MASQEATAAAIGAAKAPASFENALLLSAFLHETERDVPEWQREVLEEIIVDGNYSRLMRLKHRDYDAMEQTVGELLAFMNSR